MRWLICFNSKITTPCVKACKREDVGATCSAVPSLCGVIAAHNDIQLPGANGPANFALSLQGKTGQACSYKGADAQQGHKGPQEEGSLKRHC